MAGLTPKEVKAPMEFTPDSSWHVRTYTKYLDLWYNRYIGIQRKIRNHGIFENEGINHA